MLGAFDYSLDVIAGQGLIYPTTCITCRVKLTVKHSVQRVNR